MTQLTSSALIIFWLVLIAILGLVVLLLYFVFSDLMRKKTWAPRILNSVFLEVSFPKENSDPEKEQQKEEKDIIAVAEQFFTTIGSREAGEVRSMLNIHDCISFEIGAVGKKLRFCRGVDSAKELRFSGSDVQEHGNRSPECLDQQPLQTASRGRRGDPGLDFTGGA